MRKLFNLFREYPVVVLDGAHLNQKVSFFWGSSSGDDEKKEVVYRWKCKYCYGEYKDTNNDWWAPECDVCHNKMKFDEKLYV